MPVGDVCMARCGQGSDSIWRKARRGQLEVFLLGFNRRMSSVGGSQSQGDLRL